MMNASEPRPVRTMTDTTDSEHRIRARWQAPDLERLDRIVEARWSAHNIPLTEARSTIMDPSQLLIGDEPRTIAIKRHLDLFLKPRTSSEYPGRLIDLGCLEGGVSFEMARAGFDVLGIEGRQANYEKCRLIADYYRLPNLDFLHLDVKELAPDRHGLFDAVICCGLLYHLDDPSGFLRQLSALTHAGSVLFLDTHVAPPDQALADCVFRDTLSELVEIEDGAHGYAGRWYQEYPESGSSDNPWASVSNHRSFWPTHSSLLFALSDAGFRFVHELHGSRDIREEHELKRRYSRVYLIALKADYFQA